MKKPVINSAVNASLPETTLEVGKPITIQLAPVGEYPQFVDDPDNEGQQKEVVQILDETAMNTLVRNFEDERLAAEKEGKKYGVLVDADHSAETSANTAAMGWVTKLFIDPEKGLMAEIDPSSEGVEKINGKVYRFVSGAWTLDDAGRPEKLVSIGLTNKPNLPVSPMINAKAEVREPSGAAVNADDGVTTDKPDSVPANANEEGEQSDAPAVQAQPEIAQNGEEENYDMNPIKEKLGLPDEATDEEVLTALDALIAKCEGMEAVENALGLDPSAATNEEVMEAVNAVINQCGDLQNAMEEAKSAQLNAEAEELVKSNADIIPEEDVEAVKEQYVEDPEAAKEAVANMRRVYNRAVCNTQKAAPTKRVSINFRAARTPVAINMETILASAGGDPAKENEMLRAMNK